MITAQTSNHLEMQLKTAGNVIENCKLLIRVGVQQLLYKIDRVG